MTTNTAPTIHLDAIVGTRPNFIKLAPLVREFARQPWAKLRIVHTGQHYDRRMSGVFFTQLGIPEPDVNLQVGAGHQGAQTATIMERYESLVLENKRPHGVIVFGDVTSTLACALVAAKLCIPIAHVEAGLRSGDRSMPEEINRIVTDAVSDILLVSDPSGLVNLAQEGHAKEQIAFVGNIMVDTLVHELPVVEKSSIVSDTGVRKGEYAFLTMHRPSNVDDPTSLSRLLALMSELSRDMPIVFAVHPRTRHQIEHTGVRLDPDSRIHMVQPLDYHDNLCMQKHARVVVTDSGGMQEETSVLGVPCLTLRFNTERPVTTEMGTSVLVGNDPERIRNAWKAALSGHWRKPVGIPLWDGNTASRIVARLSRDWSTK